MAEDTRREILESAVQLFSKNNYHAVSMSEIAEGAGVSKGTLYWHFDSKKELFHEIAIKGMNYFGEEFEKISNQNKNFEKKIKEIVHFVLMTFAEHITMLDVFRNNIELLNQDFKNEIEKKHRQNVEIVADIIAEGIEEGLIKDANPVDISMMMLSILFTPQTKDLLQSNDDVEKKIDFIYDFIMNGISRKEN